MRRSPISCSSELVVPFPRGNSRWATKIGPLVLAASVAFAAFLLLTPSTPLPLIVYAQTGVVPGPPDPPQPPELPLPPVDELLPDCGISYRFYRGDPCTYKIEFFEEEIPDPIALSNTGPCAPICDPVLSGLVWVVSSYLGATNGYLGPGQGTARTGGVQTRSSSKNIKDRIRAVITHGTSHADAHIARAEVNATLTGSVVTFTGPAAAQAEIRINASVWSDPTNVDEQLTVSCSSDWRLGTTHGVDFDLSGSAGIAGVGGGMGRVDQGAIADGENSEMGCVSGSGTANTDQESTTVAAGQKLRVMAAATPSGGCYALGRAFISEYRPNVRSCLSCPFGSAYVQW